MGAWEGRVVDKVVRQPFGGHVSGPWSCEINIIHIHAHVCKHTARHMTIPTHVHAFMHVHKCTSPYTYKYTCTRIHTQYSAHTHAPTQAHRLFFPLHPSLPGCTEQVRSPGCGNGISSFPGYHQGTRKAIPLQTGLRTLQKQSCTAPAFLGSPSSLELGKLLYPPSCSPRSPTLSGMRTSGRGRRGEAGYHDFISLGQADQLPLGPLPAISSPECVFVFVWFVLFPGLNYHVAADSLSGVVESESSVFGAGQNERSAMVSKKQIRN